MLAPAEMAFSSTPSAATTKRATRTTKFHAQGALELAEDLGVRNGAARLVVLDDGRLLVDLLCEVLLRELLLLACGLDRLSDRGRYLGGRCNLVFAVELRYSLVVGACEAGVRSGRMHEG